MGRRQIPPEDVERAGRLLRDGKSLRGTSRETGISVDALKRRFGKPTPDTPPNPATEAPKSTPPSPSEGGRPRRDPPPRARSRRRAPAKPTDAELEGMARKAAKLPAIPLKMWVDCDYCYAHVRDTAPALAAELVADDDMREVLEWVYVNVYRYKAIGLLGAYIGVPLVHHVAPDFIYGAVGPLMGMPPRRLHTHHSPPPASAAQPQADHMQPATAEGTNGSAAPPAPPLPTPPFGGMDTDTLLTMAKQFGIEIPEGLDLTSILGGTDAATATEAPADGDAAPDTAPAAAAPADPHPEQ